MSKNDLKIKLRFPKKINKETQLITKRIFELLLPNKELVKELKKLNKKLRKNS